MERCPGSSRENRKRKPTCNGGSNRQPGRERRKLETELSGMGHWGNPSRQEERGPHVLRTLLFIFQSSERFAEDRKHFWGAQIWPQTGSMHLPLHVCQEKHTTPTLAVFIWHLVKFCLCKAKQTSQQGHKTHGFELFNLLPTERGNISLFCSCQLVILALTGGVWIPKTQQGVVPSSCRHWDIGTS